MKYLTVALSSLILAVVINAPQVNAVTPPDNCFAFNAGTGVITNYYAHEANNIANPACPRDLDIPATIGGVSVTGIGHMSMPGRQLTSVTIPSSVTTISNYAFSNNELTTITIPEGVVSIGSNAFNANQLTEVTLSSTLLSIGPSAFYENFLTDVTIPGNVTSIGNWAFRTNNLSSVTIENGVLTIGNSAFSTNQLTEIAIPSSVTSLGNYAFYANRLTSVTIPSSVTNIGLAAFALQNQWGGSLDVETPGVPYLWSDDPSVVQTAYDSIWYVRLYTADPSNPGGFIDDILDENWWWGVDGNANGLNDPLGGHLINPATIEVQYIDESSQALQPSSNAIGLMGGEYLENYFVTQGPTIPFGADPQDPTPEEQEIIDEALSVYYRMGGSVAIDPVAIDGYITPEPQIFVLGAADNTFNYVYVLGESTEPDDTSPGPSTDPVVTDEDEASPPEPTHTTQDASELADTGVSMLVYLAGAIGMSLAGGVLMLLRPHK